jgi:hypothetical protein
MQYLHQICCMYLVVIKVFITWHLYISDTLLMNEVLVNEPVHKNLRLYAYNM